MDKYIIEGGRPLYGEVEIQSAKNAVLPLLAASVLTEERVVIRRCPRIADVLNMVQILGELGCKTGFEGDALIIDGADAANHEIPSALARELRSSVFLLGSVVARFGRARIAYPGGCDIGLRPVDLHLQGLRRLGVGVREEGGCIDCSCSGVRGAEIVLDCPSVGATENILLAAVTARGTTVIRNAAREPEIVDLANMLVAMGARVEGAGTSTIEVEGVPLSSLHPCEHTTVGDRIEAGTFLAGGALMGGPVTVRGIDPSFLRMALMKLQAMGCDVQTGDGWITVARTGALLPTDIQTLPHPGFPTDLQAQFMLLAARAEGSSVITENVFENRFMFAAELGRMGADITIEGHHALVRGVKGLQGAPVSATDLRAGAAIVLAGISAEGETRVHHIEHIDRGYEDYVGKLVSLGADVRRAPADVPVSC